MEQQQGPLAHLWGVASPMGYVVAILPDEDSAREASEALVADGIAAEDVQVHPGQEVAERHDRLVQDPAGERLLSAMTDDERVALDEYVEEAREGSAFVTVRVSGGDQVRRAHAVLSDIGAYGMRHDDRAILRDLD